MRLAGLSKRERLILNLCITIVGLSLLYNFVVSPWRERWDALNRGVLTQRAKLERNLRVIAREEPVRVEYERYSGYVRQEGSDEEEMASLLREVETLASSSGVHITEIKPRPVREMEFYNKYTLELESKAEINDLVRFIYELHKSSRPLKVERLQLSARGKGTSILKSYILITRVLIP